jgi:hypothetical protein
MSNAEEHDNKIVIRVGNPEKIPGNPESYRKMANEFEGAGCALDALGELIKNVDFDRMEESTPEGIGILLKILGNQLMQNCFDALDMCSEADKQQELNQSPDLSKSVEANRSRV